MSLDRAASEVLRLYPAAGPGHLHPLGNRGGFSGARLWRVESTGNSFCLRAWPEVGMSPARLLQIHQLMMLAHKTELDFVPVVQLAHDGRTFVEHAGRLWELTTWMPGRADFHDRPSSAHLEAACLALARLHCAWQTVSPSRGPCPGVQRRLAQTNEWSNLVASGWRPAFGLLANRSVAEWAERAWRIVPERVGRIAQQLAPWQTPVPLQPCLCDVWHEHVLFTDDAVTGLVDYGSIKQDHIAVDLARLLGSMASKDVELFRIGLMAYGQLRPLSEREQQMVHVLDETGTVIAAANWLRWLYHERRQYEDWEEVGKRLGALVRRIEEWK
jgi:thiamine kinase-like enzyme